VNVCLGREVANAMASKHVYGRSCDEVVLRNERDVVRAYAFISYLAVERVF